MAKPPPTSDFFKKRKPSNKVSLLEDKTHAPAAKKKYSHHTPTNSFSPNNINKRVNNYIDHQPLGNWQQNQNGSEIPYTLRSRYKHTLTKPVLSFLNMANAWNYRNSIEQASGNSKL